MGETPGRADPPDGAADPRIGRVLQDRYRITGTIASGGMGVVYRGERLGLGRVVAIKFLHATMARDPNIARRFEIEARAMSRLCHPNCIGVLDYGVDELPYVVIDYVEGQPLDALVRKGPVPARRAVKIVRQILAALAHAHAQGIIHRDIKPENVVLEGSAGLEDHVRILDFGLAKLAGADFGLTVGLAVGTPHYMAPEQMSEAAIDGRADLYAAAIVLFELVTGKKPFDGEEVGDVLLRHLGSPPPKLREVAPWARASAELEALIVRAMAKKPADRFASAEAMAAAMDELPEALGTPGPEAVGRGARAMATDVTDLGSALTPVATPVPAPLARLPASPSPSPAPLAVPPVSGTEATMAAPSGNFGTPAPDVPPAPPQEAAPDDELTWRSWFFARPFWFAVATGLGSTLLAGALIAVGFSGGLSVPPPPPPAAVAPPLGDLADKPEDVAPRPPRPAAKAAAPARSKAERAREPARGAAELIASGQRAFAQGRPGAGLGAFREAIRLDGRRRGDEVMLASVIGGLGNDRKGECAAFLRELGVAAHPALREAARSHPNAKVRARAAELLPPAPTAAPAKKKSFLRWL